MAVTKDTRGKAGGSIPRPCKHCGIKFSTPDKRQNYCSRDCGFKARRIKRVVVQCCVCGDLTAKTSSQVRKQNCCSLKCQRVLALEVNRGRPKRSKPVYLPVLHRCECGRLCSKGFCRVCEQWIAKLVASDRDEGRRFGKTTWIDKLRSVAYLSRHRSAAETYIHMDCWTRQEIKDEQDRQAAELDQYMRWTLRLERISGAPKESDKWVTKLNNKASNARSRMGRKSQAGSLSG